MSETSVKNVLDESLSALVDGEISELELRRLLKADDQAFEELRGRWSSYQMTSASMKDDVPNVAFTDLSASISARIADEDSHSLTSNSSTKNRKQSIWSGVGRFAIAASVAGAVVLGVQFAPSTIDGQVADIDTPASGVKVPSSFGHGLPTDTAISTVSNESNPVVKQQKEAIVITESTKQQLQKAENEVNRLMLEHAQNSAQNTEQGVLPYARVPESSQEQ